jgi:2-deoxy-D-gluconate 3-dehydrogenase
MAWKHSEFLRNAVARDTITIVNTLDLFRLDGKLALVTGCRRGIGRAMAAALAEAGADVIGVSRSLESSGSDVEREITALGRHFYPYACDFRDRRAVYSFLNALQARFAAVDILINNAGAILRKPALEHPDEYWDEVLEINLNAQWVITREIGKGMVARGEGKIIFIASLLSFQGGITVPGYAASKGAIAQLTKALANEWAARGVQVNAIAPGYIETDNTQALRQDPERNAAILARIPAGRWGVPADLKGVTVFLASRASDYVNGAVIVVDGGWLGR